MKITFKEKEYEIVEKITDLKSKDFFKITDAQEKYTAEKINIYEFNFIYASIFLGLEISILENSKPEEFIKLINDINTIISNVN